MNRYSKYLVLFLVITSVFLVGQTVLLRNFEMPVSSYEFRVEINGVDAGCFDSVSGLRIDQDVIEIQSEDTPFILKSAGRIRYGDIVLRRGYLVGTQLNDWIEASLTDEPVATNMSIILVDTTPPWDKGVEIKRWNCYGCVPRSWSLSPLNNSGTGVITEEIVIAIEWFEEVEPGYYISR